MELKFSRWKNLFRIAIITGLVLAGLTLPAIAAIDTALFTDEAGNAIAYLDSTTVMNKQDETHAFDCTFDENGNPVLGETKTVSVLYFTRPDKELLTASPDFTGYLRARIGIHCMIDGQMKSHYILASLRVLQGEVTMYDYEYFSYTDPDGSQFQQLEDSIIAGALDSVKVLAYDADFNPLTGQSTELYYKVISEPPSQDIAAAPTASEVLVDGKEIAFDAYNIQDNNYFKLRDVAKVVSSTSKQFEVTWDNDKKAINMVSGQPYTAVGGELTQGDGISKTAALNTAKVYLDGKEVSLTAYNIGGNNYIKLRDLGQLLNFGVTWSGATNTIVIDTSTGYTAD